MAPVMRERRHPLIARDNRDKHVASEIRAPPRDGKPCGTTKNRNAALESGRIPGISQRSQVGCKDFFCHECSSPFADDPRADFHTNWRHHFQMAEAVPADVLAAGELVPAAPLGLSRSDDNVAAPLAPTTPALLGDRHRCSNNGVHSPGRTRGCTPSANTDELEACRGQLVQDDAKRDPVEGPREVVLPEVKSRIEGANFNPRRFIAVASTPRPTLLSA